MATVTFVSKEQATSKSNKPYWKVTTSDGKSGSVFFDPALNIPIDLDEKYDDKWKNYSWFKKDGNFQSKTGVQKTYNSGAMADATLRAAALGAAKDWGLLAREQNSAVSADSVIEVYKKFLAVLKAE